MNDRLRCGAVKAVIIVSNYLGLRLSDKVWNATRRAGPEECGTGPRPRLLREFYFHFLEPEALLRPQPAPRAPGTWVLPLEAELPHGLHLAPGLLPRVEAEAVAEDSTAEEVEAEAVAEKSTAEEVEAEAVAEESTAEEVEAEAVAEESTAEEVEAEAIPKNEKI